MNMVQFMLHVMMLEREMETYQQDSRSQYDNVYNVNVVRKPRMARINGFIERIRRIKLEINTKEGDAAKQSSCRTEKRPFDPAVSQCSPLRSGGSK